jgi:hypothetical protein
MERPSHLYYGDNLPILRAMTPVAYLETSVLYCDDNLNRLAPFPTECVDFIYPDPPFFSNGVGGLD